MPYYGAAEGDALTRVHAEIGTLVNVGDPSAYTLDATPSDPKFLTVLVDGVSTPSGPDSWTNDAGKVTFHGVTCELLKNSTPGTSVDLKFRIVEGL